MHELDEARLARAYRAIEQFAPAPEPERPVPHRRDIMAWLVRNNRPHIWKRATNTELAEVVTILEGVLRRHSL